MQDKSLPVKSPSDQWAVGTEALAATHSSCHFTVTAISDIYHHIQMGFSKTENVLTNNSSSGLVEKSHAFGPGVSAWGCSLPIAFNLEQKLFCGLRGFFDTRFKADIHCESVWYLQITACDIQNILYHINEQRNKFMTLLSTMWLVWGPLFKLSEHVYLETLPHHHYTPWALVVILVLQQEMATAGMAWMVCLVWTRLDWVCLGEVCSWEEAADDWYGCLLMWKKTTVLFKITH